LPRPYFAPLYRSGGEAAVLEKTGEPGGKASSLKGGAAPSKALGTRTLMSFRGCALHLGCTVVLKGASAHQLGLVKKVLQVYPPPS